MKFLRVSIFALISVISVASGETDVDYGYVDQETKNKTVAPMVKTTVAQVKNVTVASVKKTTASPVKESVRIVRRKTTVAPKETTVAPKNTTVAPKNTTVAAKNTTVAPKNTTVAFKKTTVAPVAETTVDIDSTSDFPEDVDDTTVAAVVDGDENEEVTDEPYDLSQHDRVNTRDETKRTITVQDEGEPVRVISDNYHLKNVIKEKGNDTPIVLEKIIKIEQTKTGKQQLFNEKLTGVVSKDEELSHMHDAPANLTVPKRRAHGNEDEYTVPLVPQIQPVKPETVESVTVVPEVTGGDVNGEDDDLVTKSPNTKRTKRPRQPTSTDRPGSVEPSTPAAVAAVNEAQCPTVTCNCHCSCPNGPGTSLFGSTPSPPSPTSTDRTQRPRYPGHNVWKPSQMEKLRGYPFVVGQKPAQPKELPFF